MEIKTERTLYDTTDVSEIVAAITVYSKSYWGHSRLSDNAERVQELVQAAADQIYQELQALLPNKVRG